MTDKRLAIGDLPSIINPLWQTDQKTKILKKKPNNVNPAEVHLFPRK